MKFAHALKEALEKDGYPKEWVDAAVPYGQLKKCLKRAQKELKAIGLDEATISQLMQPSESEEGDSQFNRRGSALALEYEVHGEKKLVPKLTLCVHFQDGEVTDVALSPSTRAYLQTLAAKQHEDEPLPDNGMRRADSIPSVHDHDSAKAGSPATKSVEVPLMFTTEFFEIIYDDVAELEKIQVQKQKDLNQAIVALSTEIGKISRPSKNQFHLSDMYRWRELFDIYLQANVFFSTREVDHGRRTAPIAATQLAWFQAEVTRRNLVSAFKIPASKIALQRFVDINLEILLNIKFQEINKQAITKILKKYDKRTRLGAQRTFPELIKEDAIISGSVAKDACAQVSTDLVKIVRQIDEFSCPICTGILYRPIKIDCGHIFCVECASSFQHRGRDRCPICRAPGIMRARSDNQDFELGKMIKKNFPIEWREAGIIQETEDGLKRFGADYRHRRYGKEYVEPGTQQCLVM